MAKMELEHDTGKWKDNRLKVSASVIFHNLFPKWNSGLLLFDQKIKVRRNHFLFLSLHSITDLNEAQDTPRIKLVRKSDYLHLEQL